MATFRRDADLLLKTALIGIGGIAVFVLISFWGVPMADYNTRKDFVSPQPVPFSHKHHVGGLGLDCRYCHNGIEESSIAPMPPTETCMTCHSQIWTGAPVLAPVRESFANGAPLQWRQVNRLPDYVFFNHGIHLVKGVACTTCHGPVNEMPLTWKEHDLYMGWCLDCHRNPEKHIRPRETVFDPDWKPSPGTPSGAELVARYHIRTARNTDCSTCHR